MSRAAVDPAGTIDLSIFAQYGVLGVLCLGLILFARTAYQRERDRGDRMEEENRKLNAAIQDRIIPVLLSATRAMEESAELMAAMQRERDLMRLTDGKPRHGSSG